MLDPANLPPWPLVLLILGIAFLYSSVGFGGASGYLAAMSLFAISTQLMAGTALVLNVLVASIAFVTFYRAGYFNSFLLLPFLLTSVPAAFLGGYVRISDDLYFLILYAALAYIGTRLIIENQTSVQENLAIKVERQPPLVAVLISGLLIGLLSGMVGLGGGIFLSPLIVLAGWGTPKQAAAASAGFIVANSASGLLGRVIGGNFAFGLLGAVLLPAGMMGALAGSRLGARYLSGNVVRRLLGVIMWLAVLHFVYEYVTL